MQNRWTIAKEFALDYGHRVWNQKLNEEYAMCSDLACRHLHGHRGTCIVFLEANDLDPQGMVTDFKNLGWFKKWLDDTLDHKFIIDRNDPLFEVLLPNFNRTMFTSENQRGEGHWFPSDVAPNPFTGTTALDSAMTELYGGFVVVDFVPTSENIARWMYNVVSIRMDKIGVKVSKIQWYETPKSQSIFEIDENSFAVE